MDLVVFVFLAVLCVIGFNHLVRWALREDRSGKRFVEELEEWFKGRAK